MGSSRISYSSYFFVFTQHSSPLNSSIHTRLHQANLLNLQITFVWIPAHVGFNPHDQVDKRAKSACLHPNPEVQLPLSKALIKRLLHDEARDELDERSNAKHYDVYRGAGFMYGKSSTLTRACDIAVARIRLGYQTLPCFRLTHSSHYIKDCPTITHFRPPVILYNDFCKYLITHPTILEDILRVHPDFLL